MSTVMPRTEHDRSRWLVARDIPVTIAHDYFTQRGGAERVAAALINQLRPDRVVTAVHSPERTFGIDAGLAVETTLLQRVSAFRRDPRLALPLIPFAWRLARPVTEGVVICSSSGWSHSIRTGRHATKIVYCHNPARWLYQPDDYLKDQSRPVRIALRMLRPLLLRWDRHAADSADVYVANSTSVARRIAEAYGRTAHVIHPPVAIDATGPQTPVDVGFGEFFLTVGRGRGYKHVDMLLAAFARMPEANLVVVGTAPRDVPLTPNVRFVAGPSDAELRWLYEHCRALMSVSHEDFGLTPLEANTMGSPALVLRAGGFLDSLAEGVSGRFIEHASEAAIEEAVRGFPRDWDRDAIRSHAERFSLGAFMERIAALVAATFEPAA
jgi:glycosyltransferase involved in cell wall biosynthesis